MSTFARTLIVVIQALPEMPDASLSVVTIPRWGDSGGLIDDLLAPEDSLEAG